MTTHICTFNNRPHKIAVERQLGDSIIEDRNLSNDVLADRLIPDKAMEISTKYGGKHLGKCLHIHMYHEKDDMQKRGVDMFMSKTQAILLRDQINIAFNLLDENDS